MSFIMFISVKMFLLLWVGTMFSCKNLPNDTFTAARNFENTVMVGFSPIWRLLNETCHKLVLSSLFLANLCWDRQIQIVAVLSLDLCNCLWQRCSSQVSYSRTVGYVTIQRSLLMFLDDKLCHFDNLMKTCLPAHQWFVGIRGLTCTVILLIFVRGCHDHKKMFLSTAQQLVNNHKGEIH